MLTMLSDSTGIRMKGLANYWDLKSLIPTMAQDTIVGSSCTMYLINFPQFYSNAEWSEHINFIKKKTCEDRK